MKADRLRNQSVLAALVALPILVSCNASNDSPFASLGAHPAASPALTSATTGDGGFIPGGTGTGTGDGGTIPPAGCATPAAKVSGSHSGIRTIDFGGNAIAMAGASVQSDGKLVVVGYATVGGHSSFALSRLNADGTLDTRYGNQGKVLTAIGSGDSKALDSFLQADGKMVAVGPYWDDHDLANHFAVARYNNDGSLDASFGQGGIVKIAMGNQDDQATAVRVQSDGKILVAGMTLQGSGYAFGVARLDAQGSLDTSYGDQGKAFALVGNGGGLPFGAALQSDGKLALAGYSPPMAIARFATDGSLDDTFGDEGLVHTPIGTQSASFDMRIGKDGKLMATGTAWIDHGKQVWATARYHEDGSLDTTWGDGGIVTTAISGIDSASRSAEQCDGKVLVAGVANDGTRFNLAVARYSPAGVLDATFNGSGKLVLSPGHGATTEMIVPQADGRLLVVGNLNPANHDDFFVARLNGDGTLDTTYGE